ncbi:uncharacterized protein LOC114435432 [Parambassis ranga]|uniref:Uncharacterized protein LOC114435432 n=1 Tax=Parambassis ranga TaxID=210632 RepID=A0A6P7HYY7_9TELE|nr:uncharacterized protein LOC114435432 [Parambassis ranga]
MKLNSKERQTTHPWRRRQPSSQQLEEMATPTEPCPLKKHLTCSICFDKFKDPVTTVCGHSFCRKCLDLTFQINDSMCPLCKTHLSKTPQVNIVLRDVVHELSLQEDGDDGSHDNDDKYTGAPGEVACDICTEQKLKAKKSCLVCLASYCSTHLENHYSTERLKGHKLVEPVENLDERACLKHGRPLELYDRKQQVCVCVRCLEGGDVEVVSVEDEWGKKKNKLENTKTELELKIKDRKTKVDEINVDLKSCKDLLENEWWDIEAVFNAVIAIVEEAQARALQPLKDRRQVLEKEAQNLKDELKAEIKKLETNISELDNIAALEDHILFLQNYPSLQDLDNIKDWVEVELDKSLSFGTMRKTTTKMVEKIQQELEKLSSIELKRVQGFPVDVQLDSATAHQRLVLSEDRKQVKDGGEDQRVADVPERFDHFGSIMALNSLTSGKSYWEVEVSNKTGWDLGVAKRDANRKGKLTLNPDNGYWVTVHYEGEKYAALTAPPTSLFLKEKPQKVGVFVDYEEGLVSFYDVTTESHIYSFPECSFKDELYPYFSPHIKEDEKNSAPLIISAAKHCEQEDKIFNMSLQVCHCGWSSKTTYHGLRTHQGKMGCTAKGMRIPESEQFTYQPKYSYLGSSNLFKQPDPSPDVSLQVCHCGWKSMTTYHGLRTHQGMMGCTPKGVRIPESEQVHPFAQLNHTEPAIKLEKPSPDIPKPSVPKSEQTFWLGASDLNDNKLTFKEENLLMSPNFITQTNLTATDAAVLEIIMSMAENQQNPLKMGTNLDKSHQMLEFTQPFPWTVTSQSNPPSTGTTVEEASHSLFQTPPRPLQTASSSDKARRVLDFSTGAQQVEKIFEPATTSAQETVICKETEKEEKEKQREAQRLLKARRDRLKAELQQKINIREHKVAEVRSSVKACKGSLDAEWLEINSVFSEVMKAVEDARLKALQPLEQRRQEVKKEAQDLIQRLHKQIDTFKRTIDELDKNPELQVPPVADLKKVSVDTSFSFGTLQPTTSTMMKEINKKLEKLSSLELKRTPAFAVDVKLDPQTAHLSLLLSDNGKEVRDSGLKPEHPDTPERFDKFGSILGRNRLTSGKSYWEVEVSNKTGWDLGVARRNANRKGKLKLNPDDGYWVTVHFEGEKYAALTAPPTSLSLKKKPQKVGVFVDYEEGLVSFYDVTTKSLIYSFTECRFGGEIAPYFSPHLKQNEKNAAPLIICAVQTQQ